MRRRGPSEIRFEEIGTVEMEGEREPGLALALRRPEEIGGTERPEALCEEVHRRVLSAQIRLPTNHGSVSNERSRQRGQSRWRCRLIEERTPSDDSVFLLLRDGHVKCENRCMRLSARTVTSDAFQLVRAAKVLGSIRQRCRVQFMRNALACVPEKAQSMINAVRRTAFEGDSRGAEKRQDSRDVCCIVCNSADQ